MRAPVLLVPVLLAPVRAADLKPVWVSALPARPGRVYGLGMAALAGNDAQALRQASDNARADVVSRLRATVKADTRITTTYQESRATGAAATGTRTQTARVGTQVQAQAEDLPGLMVEETFVDRPGASAYALACLDLAIARRELQARLDAARADLAADRGGQGVRARLVAAQALRKGYLELLKLEDLSALLGGGGGDPALRQDVAKARIDTEQRMAAARAALTFGLAPAPGVEPDPDVQDAVRTAVLQEGMGWSDQNPMFSITLRVRAGRSGAPAGRQGWWDHRRTPDFVIAQGSLSLGLVDADGQQYQSVTLVAKGVGVNEFQADSLFRKDCRDKLAKAVSAWLADLGRW